MPVSSASKTTSRATGSKLSAAKKQQQRKRSLKRRVTKPKQQKGAGYHPINGTLTPGQEGGMTMDSNSMLYLGTIVMLGIVIYLVFQTRETQREIIAASNNFNMAYQLTPNKYNYINNNNNDPSQMYRDRAMTNEPHLDRHDMHNHNRLSHHEYIERKNHERVINPLLPPERSYENTYGIPINVPTRGASSGYQQVGYMYKDSTISDSNTIGSGSESVLIPIYGRPTYPGGKKWNYYVSSDKFHSVKIPFNYNGRQSDDDHGVTELNDGETVELPAYNGQFQVNMYNYDSPKYLPYV